MLVFGIYGGVGLFYRFAAVDAAPAESKSTAISLVMAGGLVGGYLGPEISKRTVDWLGVPFLGAYLSVVVYLALTLVVLVLLRIPTPSEAEQRAEGRPLAQIAAQPSFIVAVIGAALGFGVMNFVMVATPLAMHAHGHHYGDTALVIQWHVIAMFAPSFITPFLIRRIGVLALMFAGVIAFATCIAIGLADITLMHFWFALVLLGIGWNFLFIGGTTLLTETYQPSERAKTQGINDFAVTFTQLFTSVGSGWMLARGGWTLVNYFAIPMIAVVGVAVLWLALKRRAMVIV
jgi:MFS family permease